MQGDFGLLYKGPYHTDALMRLPFIWRPAPSAGIAPADVQDPVGHVDLAPTFCAIAGIDAPDWGRPPPAPAASRSPPASSTTSTATRINGTTNGTTRRADRSATIWWPTCTTVFPPRFAPSRLLLRHDGSVVQTSQRARQEQGGCLDHGIVTHPVEPDDGGIGSGGEKRVDHGRDGDRVVHSPHDVQW